MKNFISFLGKMTPEVTIKNLLLQVALLRKMVTTQKAHHGGGPAAEKPKDVAAIEASPAASELMPCRRATFA